MGWFGLQVANGPNGATAPAVVQAAGDARSGPEGRVSWEPPPASGPVPVRQQCPRVPSTLSFTHVKPSGQASLAPHTRPPFLTLSVL